MSTILKPVPMARVAVIGLKKFRQQILTILHEMNIIQLEPLSKATDSFLARERESELHNEISDQLLRIKGLLGSLPPTKIVGKSGFLSLNELISTIKSLDIDSKIASLEREKDNLTTQKRETENNIKLVEEFSFFHEDFNILDLSFARSYFGRVASDKFPDFKKELESESPDIMIYSKETDKITHFVLIITPTFRSASLASSVNSHNVHLEVVPKLRGKPEIIIQNQKNINNTLSSKLNQINNQLTEISKMYYKFLKGAEEQLEIENRKLEIIDHLGVTEDAFALEGWIPKSKIENLRTAFKKHSEGTILYDLDSKENPPTLLATPKKLKDGYQNQR
jgi:V/A-type H+-transporting ATPase subunit I